MKRGLFLWGMVALLGAVCLCLPSCSDDKGGVDGPKVEGAPRVSFNTQSGLYVVKVNKSVELKATVSNALNPEVSWKQDGKIVSRDTVYTFSSKVTGEYYLKFRVDAANGSAEEEVRVDVVDKTPPVVSLPIPEEGYLTAVTGQDLLISPSVKYSEGATYEWVLEGQKVGTDSVYVFRQTEETEYAMTLTVKNEDGQDRIAFRVRVVPVPVLNIAFEQEELVVPVGRTLYLQPIVQYATAAAVYEWRVDGAVQAGTTGAMFVYTPAGEGEVTVEVTGREGETVERAVVQVKCVAAEGTYYRKATATSQVKCNRVYEFLPAPGQFVNEGYTATTMAEACAYAEERLRSEAYVSLGGFGGYVVVGFDHSVDNKAGEYDFGITGNSFAGSSEPGIVWVMQDENGNGLPDDTWYELKGSETGKPETSQGYAVTYYRPKAPKMDVQWTDSRGKSGCVDYMAAYHHQDYYYPAWVKENSYTLRGTCLGLRNTQSGETGFWYNGEYDWGYADNFGNDRLSQDDNQDAAPNSNYFKIENAVYPDGSPVDLKYIDFVKVQCGVNGKSGWLGEISTEVFGVFDYKMKY